MKINYKITKKRNIKIGDKVTLISSEYESLHYIQESGINFGEVFIVQDIRKSENDLSFKEKKVVYWQQSKYYKLAE